MAQPRLTSVTVTEGDNDDVAVGFTTDQPMPIEGTVLCSVLAATASDPMGYQLGVKYLDGRQIGHFVFDHQAARQHNLDGAVTVEGTTVTASFPRAQMPGLAESFEWSATLNIDGADVHSLPRETFTPQP